MSGATEKNSTKAIHPVYIVTNIQTKVRVLDGTKVLDPDFTAYDAWSKLQNVFLNNKGSREAALEHEFNNLTLRAMTSLEAYHQRLKDLSGQLNDVECPVNE
uniref:Uncharacterized protein n=1 Tax=Lactuca sativa TaxID=4236 RepID=A0A9R1XDF6_LACSA|nr:hypothetical protein LSAT_V11C500260780 [Lactuca sativa]